MAFDADQHRDDPHFSPVLIVGTGFAGLCMGIKLKEAGFDRFLILERAQSVGGTWRDNRYPGCACDVQSHVYSFSFEPNPDWTRMFAPQPEIKAYLERCAEKYRLVPHIRFGAEVVRAAYDEAAQVWQVTTRDGRRFRARVLVSGMGGLSTPAYPDLPGLERFQGKAFHSAAWDHGCELRGKRVAVIGTGASAIQFVPQIAPAVAQLDLYQRTPPWIMPKPDRAIGRVERALFRRFPLAQRAMRAALYWLLESRAAGFVLAPRVLELASFAANVHLRRQVPDAALRKKLAPDYAMGCKRVLMSDDYYPALTRANVEVVADAIREVRAHGIVTADGRERPADVLIYGTGFKAQDPLPRGTLLGRGGLDILDAWKDGMEAYLGTAVAGFPNLFLLVGPNTGLGHNSMVYMIESQVHYVMECLKTMRRDGLAEVEPRAEVQARYNSALQARLGGSVWTSGCRSWYLDRNGRNTTLWPGFTFGFRRATRRFRVADYLVAAERQELPA